MKRPQIVLSLLLVTVASITSAASASNTFSAQVVGVQDGDSITVLDASTRQHKIRLATIAAPELSQAYGRAAKQHLSDLIFGQVVRLDCQPRLDRYQRKICVVLLADRDINLAQLHAGMAWWYRQFAKYQTPARREAYERAEGTARDERIGLWSPNLAPTPPWAYRRARKN